MFFVGYGGFKGLINYWIRSMAVTPWFYAIWTKLFPHVFVHKHGQYWYWDGHGWECDTWPRKYGGWHPFMYCKEWWHFDPSQLSKKLGE